MLMVTTTVRMLYGILCHTSDLRPAVTFDSVLVVRGTSLEQRLVGTATASDDTNLGAYCGGDSFLSATGQSETGGALLFVVRDDDSERTTATGKGSTVTQLGFHVAYNGTFRDGGQRQNVSDSQGSLRSAVNELTSVHAFGANEQFVVTLVEVSVSELYLSDGGTTTGVVHNVLHHTTDVSMLLGVVQGTKLHRTLTSTGVSLENGGLTLTLTLNRKKEPRGQNSSRERLLSITQSSILFFSLVYLQLT
jgi:hypothetical protein